MEYIIISLYLCVALWLFITKLAQYKFRKSFVVFYGHSTFLSFLLIGILGILKKTGLLGNLNQVLAYKLLISLISFNLIAMILCTVDMGDMNKQRRVSTRLPIIGLLLTPLLKGWFYPAMIFILSFSAFAFLFSKRDSLQLLFRSFRGRFILTMTLVIMTFANFNSVSVIFGVSLVLLVTVSDTINQMLVKDYLMERL